MTIMKRLPWLVKGLIAEGHTYLLLGKPHRGKSWFADQLGVSVASGNNFLGEFPAKQGSVILIDEDTPKQVLEWRLERLCSFMEVSLKAIPLDYRSMRGFQLDSGRDVDALKQDTMKLKAPVLVILDCLDSMSGDWDTNKTPDAKKIVAVWNKLKATGATLLVVHHMTLKGKEDEEIYDTETDFTKLGMGNTRLIAGSDSAFGMWQLPGKGTLFAVKKKERRVVLDIPELFAVQLVEDEEKNWAFLWFRNEVPRLPSVNAKTISRLFVLNPGQIFTFKEVRKETGEVLSDMDTRNALKELHRNAVLKLGREKHNLHRYSLNPDFPSMSTDYAEALRQ